MNNLPSELLAEIIEHFALHKLFSSLFSLRLTCKSIGDSRVLELRAERRVWAVVMKDFEDMSQTHCKGVYRICNDAYVAYWEILSVDPFSNDESEQEDRLNAIADLGFSFEVVEHILSWDINRGDSEFIAIEYGTACLAVGGSKLLGVFQSDEEAKDKCLDGHGTWPPVMLSMTGDGLQTTEFGVVDLDWRVDEMELK